jgi:hypothetical protein
MILLLAKYCNRALRDEYSIALEKLHRMVHNIRGYQVAGGASHKARMSMFFYGTKDMTARSF